MTERYRTLNSQGWLGPRLTHRASEYPETCPSPCKGSSLGLYLPSLGFLAELALWAGQFSLLPPPRRQLALVQREQSGSKPWVLPMELPALVVCKLSAQSPGSCPLCTLFPSGHHSCICFPSSP